MRTPAGSPSEWPPQRGFRLRGRAWDASRARGTSARRRRPAKARHPRASAILRSRAARGAPHDHAASSLIPMPIPNPSSGPTTQNASAQPLSAGSRRWSHSTRSDQAVATGDVPAPPHRRSKHASHTRGCDWEAAADTPEGTGPDGAAIDHLVKCLGRVPAVPGPRIGGEVHRTRRRAARVGTECRKNRTRSAPTRRAYRPSSCSPAPWPQA
jgi:hypothetical protein